MVNLRHLAQYCSLLLAAAPRIRALRSDLNNDTSRPVVDLGYVKYRGTANSTSGVNSFRGIRYAAPPVGDLRWREPLRIETHNNFSPDVIQNATEWGHVCSQDGTLLDFPWPASEDCLFLDVQTPTREHPTLLPVVVQIHGGGWIGGSSGTTPADAMIHASNGSFVSVAIQYRLGLLGYLSGSAVRADGALNAGLLDQRLAIEWVQRNIRAFGGDPSQVTIWGGSAGGGSVGFQLIANGGHGDPPFAAAIASYPAFPMFKTEIQQEAQYRYVLRASNCSSLECLRRLSASRMARLNDQMLNATAWTSSLTEAGLLVPVVDGSFIRGLPNNEFNLGHFYDVPLLVDRDSYEGYQFSNMSMTTQAEETADAKTWFPPAGPSFFARLYELYPRSSFNSTFWQRQAWFGDYLINCPTQLMAMSAVDHNQNRSSVFKLVFGAGTQQHGAVSDFLDSADIDIPSANNRTLANIMLSYYISFITTHDPNPLKAWNAPMWPNYSGMGRGSTQDGEAMGFGALNVTYTTIESVRDPDAGPHCDFWSSRRYQAQN